VDVKALLVAKAESIEDCFHAIERMIAIQEAFIAKATKTTVVPPMLIVWDSLGGTPTREEIEKPPEQVTMGTAKVVKRNFRRLMARLADARVALVFSNQFYQGIGPYAPPLSTYGGSGVRYFTSLRLWLKRRGALKVSDSEVGHRIEARLKKTRVGRPQDPVEIGLIYGAGVHNAYTLYEWGLKHDHAAIR
jgi:recombination protein RecA